MSARLYYLLELIFLVTCVVLLLLWHYSRDAIRTFAWHEWLWVVLPPLAIIWLVRHTRWARGLRRQLGSGEEKVRGRHPATPRITEGITIGVTSGLILSAFLWTGSYIEDRRIRDQQLYNLWRTIEYHREDLLAPDKSEQWKELQFRSMEMFVEHSLRYRSSHLRMREIDDILWMFVRFKARSVPTGDKEYDQHWYEKLYQRFDTLDWRKEQESKHPDLFPIRARED